MLVVDDSPTMRGLLKSTLGKEKDIEVVATVPDCNAARDAVKTLSPDVITLDVEMPGMDGLEFLRRLMQSRPTPVIMVSGLTAKNEDASIKAMSLGAVDCFVKPKRGGIEGFHELANLVRLAAKARVHRGQHPVRQHVSPQGNYNFRDDVVVAIGSSTGGIEALETVIRDFPENCPPTLITQHMPEGFTRSLAQRLDAKCKATIVEATDGARILPGHIYIAPGGDLHLEIMGRKNRVCRLRSDDKVNGHCPSVDVLFNSVAKYAGSSAVGVSRQDRV
ncbi:chemotaxis-specific protein-glutamate methyltransferase CheB [Parvularcula marina]|uniref:chemotaxis-specific protein-glutamate methyltransferase CheB n=1 Tax=Parvularcula marina TaxID=2292771 RepID=UPI00355A80B0